MKYIYIVLLILFTLNITTFAIVYYHIETQSIFIKNIEDEIAIANYKINKMLKQERNKQPTSIAYSNNDRTCCNYIYADMSRLSGEIEALRSAWSSINHIDQSTDHMHRHVVISEFKKDEYLEELIRLAEKAKNNIPLEPEELIKKQMLWGLIDEQRREKVKTAASSAD